MLAILVAFLFVHLLMHNTAAAMVMALAAGGLEVWPAQGAGNHMDAESKNKKLGMERAITRRDFLNGVAIGVGGSFRREALRPEDMLAAGFLDDFAPEKAPDYYPPALMGMRGNHDGTYTYAHRLRDGAAQDSFGAARDTQEHYDLIVVGGGISGLAAAYFFRKNAG